MDLTMYALLWAAGLIVPHDANEMTITLDDGNPPVVLEIKPDGYILLPPEDVDIPPLAVTPKADGVFESEVMTINLSDHSPEGTDFTSLQSMETVLCPHARIEGNACQIDIDLIAQTIDFEIAFSRPMQAQISWQTP